ncbi:MAG TPA: energy transducer TonB [Candidatus Binatia bacterium]|nr:energy transducer TonB [Candidatus Binatia bacterium]
MQITRFVALSVLVALAAFAAAQDNPPPKRLRVSSGVANSLKIHDAQPHYPREAKEQGIQGDVILQATIDAKGNLVNLKAVQGDPILVKAAVDAVKKWRYRPYILNGEPVEVETTIKIQFHMR